jgi:hypothetical protein
MKKAFFVVTAMVLLAKPALADRSGLLTYDEFLASHDLTRADVKCINPQTEDVLNILSRDWDRGQTICEVWINEKVTPAQPLTYKDGAQCAGLHDHAPLDGARAAPGRAFERVRRARGYEAGTADEGL